MNGSPASVRPKEISYPREISSGSVETGGRVLSRLFKGLALGAIPLAVIGGLDIYSGGIIGPAVTALVNGITRINWSEILAGGSGKIVENLGSKLGEVGNSVQAGVTENYHPDIQNFQIAATNALDKLRKLTLGAETEDRPIRPIGSYDVPTKEQAAAPIELNKEFDKGFNPIATPDKLQRILGNLPKVPVNTGTPDNYL